MTRQGPRRLFTPKLLRREPPEKATPLHWASRLGSSKEMGATEEFLRAFKNAPTRNSLADRAATGLQRALGRCWRHFYADAQRRQSSHQLPDLPSADVKDELPDGQSFG